MTNDAFVFMAPYAQTATSGLPQLILMFAAFGAFFYFLIIRPQQQQRKRHQEMIDALKRGDEVILQGGLHGKVSKVHDDLVDIEIAKDVVVKQVKSMIISVANKTDTKDKK